MADDSYLKEDLIAIRKELGLTQQEMANKLNMALRSYQAIESGESEYRYIHRLAVERIALQIAVDRKSPLLAPPSVRKDAIELIKIGRATCYPEFLIKEDSSRGPRTKSREVNEFRDAYEIVGEIVLLATALDHQLNHILIQVLSLEGSPMLESVVATLNMNRKIEMLKERSKFISNPDWQKPLAAHLEKLEEISSWRNIACHNVLVPDEKHVAVFAPTAAARLMKNLLLGENQGVKKIPVKELIAKLTLGESALASGENLIVNFTRMNLERIRRHPRSAPTST
ncbi:MAG: helix-turn-helix domain-containing protein [Methylovirgula sp.]|jgi:transcriptional regulator with XRE-family HTH domain